ncbi:portal protein [Pseudoalteromonas phage vB_PalP_Y7]|nr:portal protein [Pseudoalteromonas phage vB_PalP_Y7]
MNELITTMPGVTTVVNAPAVEITPENLPDPLAITIEELRDILAEVEQQPEWRAIANTEMDYADGNQLNGDLMRRQKELGLPPAIENLIGPQLRAIQGYEAASRTDWRVTPNGEVGGQDVADALNYKINQAERNSKADKACSDAFATQIGCGIGWVEVSSESDPFKYPYRCRKVHRNEIHWDMTSTEADLSDAKWLRRLRWYTPERVALAFPDHKDVIMSIGRHGAGWYATNIGDGMSGTSLGNAHGYGRPNTLQEERWYNPTNKEVCVFELWYRRWEAVPVIKTPDGRIVEYDENNEKHFTVVAAGMTKPYISTVCRVRRSYWLGPHLLHDGPSPYAHNHFPYVPFFGFREDSTGIPYGYIRDMKYPQDSLNSGNSKLRWGMSVTRIERTAGAVDMTDAQLRAQAARPDADILLNANAMAKTGARFEIIRDYQLTDQHYQMLRDNRDTIERTSGISPSFKGGKGNAQSGYQEQIQVEQSNQSLADMMDNFRESRKQVGELLLSMIIQDLGGTEQAIVVAGDTVTEDRVIIINKVEVDPVTGQTYLSNDVQRTRLMVALEDVPSTNTYRGQQLAAFSEAVKSLPPEFQVAALPYMVALMDMPHKEKFIEDIRKQQEQKTPEQWEEEIKQAVEAALVKANNDIKQREIEIKERKSSSEIKEIEARAVQIGVQAAYSAMQAGGQIAQMPQIAGVADEVMKGAGYQTPNPIGDDPNFPTAEQVPPIDPNVMPAVQQNTSPAYPPVPQDGPSPMQGIETPVISDNI